MPYAGLRNAFLSIDRSWLVLAATIPFWALLALSSHSFSAPDVCFSPTLPTIDRAMLGVALQFGWSGSASSHLFTWPLMVAATSIPSIFPMAQYVAVRSFRERRARSIGFFVLGYWLPWMCALPLAISTLTILSVLVPTSFVGSTAFAMTALWYLSPAAAWAWRHKHSTGPLAVHGFRADASAFLSGARHGGWCVAWCGPVMVAALSLHNHVAAMALTWPILLLQEAKLASPRRTALSIFFVGLILASSEAYLAPIFPA